MALNNRKGGLVARVRVNPKDCLAILDVMEAIGMDPYQHSFSGCVAIALSSLIAVARRAGAIKEEEDGLQYLNRTEYFHGQVSTKVKRERTNTLYERGQRGFTAPIPPIREPQKGDIIPIRTPFDRAAGMAEYESLKPIADEHMSAGNMNTPEVARFLELQDKLF